MAANDDSRQKDLEGHSALVTGAGQGLGREIALNLARAGAEVIVTHIRGDGAAQVASEIVERGGKAIGLKLDVSDPAEIEAAVSAAEAWGQCFDILVNCAGGMHPFTPFLEVSESMWDETMGRNFKGCFFLSQHFSRLLVATGRPGRIVNIASTAAFKPDFQLAAYNASKAAVVSLTRSIAVELGRHRILVNAVVPGPVRTANTEWIYSDPAIAAELRRKIPLGAPAEPQDVADAVIFLAGAGANHITGTTLTVDGGFMWR